MRHIGNLNDEQQAATFGDFLTANGIRNEVERDGNSWIVWVKDEDQVGVAEGFLERFRANPAAPEFRDAEKSAAKAREAEAEDLAAYRRRIRTRRALFPKFGGHGIGVLTYALIFVCLIVAFYSDLGKNHDFNRMLYISDPDVPQPGFLPEVFSGQIWRLFTPIFIHFGMLHILFNMLWLFQLGCMIEGRHSSLYLLGLVAGTALISNVAQYCVYYFMGIHAGAGGMSGVVYGLFGYVWMRGKYDPGAGVGIDRQSITIMLVWLVICFTGAVGPVANTAHLAGMLSGMAWGRLSAFIASRTPK